MVEAAEIPSLDEVPILAVAAAAAHGTTRFRDVGELRVKESDRLAGTAELVRAFGGDAEIEGDDLVVEGTGGPLQAGRRRRPAATTGWPWPRPSPPPPARRRPGHHHRRLGVGGHQLPGLRRRPGPAPAGTAGR